MNTPVKRELRAVAQADTKLSLVKPPSALMQELGEFVRAGNEFGFANPQSMTEGDYQGKFVTIGGKKSIDLTRLDYLSFGQSDAVRDIMSKAIRHNDIGCPSSQMALKTGSTIRLEQAISDFHGMKDSVLFLNGYSANENVIQALALRMRTTHMVPYVRMAGLRGFSDIPTGFFVDEETHFSLVNGIKAAKFASDKSCVMHRYRTADYDHLVEQLEKSLKSHGDKMIRFIVTDTISSMSGRVYDVGKLCEIAERFDCMLYVDEAHAIGTMGEEGRGITSELPAFEKYRDRLLIMGTLTKAVSQLGGYVAVPNEVLSCFLRCASPHYIFSAPLPPWMAEAIVSILDMVRGTYGKRERRKLHSVSAYMREQLVENEFDILGSQSQIIPILGGKEEVSIKIKQYLQEQGFTVALFECPAVPKGKSIVRFSLCSDITFEEVDRIMEHLLKARRIFGL